jgi:hypothetical protein
MNRSLLFFWEFLAPRSGIKVANTIEILYNNFYSVRRSFFILKMKLSGFIIYRGRDNSGRVRFIIFTDWRAFFRSSQNHKLYAPELFENRATGLDISLLRGALCNSS